MSQNIIFPQGPIVDIQSGYLSLEWFMWLQNPQFLSIILGTPIDVINGGTGLSSGTSGGILGFVSTTTMASSVALTNHAIVLGRGAGATPVPLASLGTSTTVLHGAAAGDPTFGAVSLTADVSGILPGANGGTGVANTGKTITLGGNLTTSGAFASVFTMTGATNVTFPTSGTLSTTTGTVTSVDVSGGTTGLTTSGGPITTSGTITLTGTLIAANGGTGFASYAVGDLIYANTTSTLAKLADVATGNALISGGVNTAPSWGKIGLTTHISGTLGAANGGTGVANNASSTITISGNFGTTITVSGTTAITLPTSGTLYGTATGSITSAQLLASLSDETGSGLAVFATSPTLTTPKATTTIGVGNATPSSSGSGITFPATADPSTDANTLDDYEEGTFTPSITFGTPGDLSVAYTTQVGFYTKIGRCVFCNYSIVTSTFTHTTASGILLIQGLPFTAANSTGIAWSGTINWAGITKANYTDYVSFVTASNAVCEVKASGTGLAQSNVSAADMPTGGTVILRGSIVYHI